MKLSYRGNRKVKNKYTRGWLTLVYDPNGSTYLQNIAYHANGMFAQISHGNGVVDFQSIGADGMKRPTLLETLYSNESFSTGEISYDGAGNITRMGNTRFAYDLVSRLYKSEQHFSNGTWRNTSFSYDPYGNLTGRSGTDQAGSFAETFPVDPATNRLSAESYNYHGEQETLFDGTGGTQWLYWDDHFEELARVGSDKYYYDADGERVIAGNRYFLRDLDGKVLSEFELSGGQMNWKKDYTYRGSQMVAMEDSDDGLQHFHLDHLGTPRLITNAAGGTLARHYYGPFGFETTNPYQDTVTKKFTGHERDGGDTPGTKYDLDANLKWVTPADEMCRSHEIPVHSGNAGIPEGMSRLAGRGRNPGPWCRSAVGVTHLRFRHARYYSPWQSRFLSVDPAGGDPKNPQSWNRYAYVLGNPLKYVDPFGEVFSFASEEAETAFWAYWDTLDVDSKDMANLMQLEDSEIEFQISISKVKGNAEGDTIFDGEKVILNVESGGPAQDASRNSRFAHEVQHGVQVNRCQLGFHKVGDIWKPWFNDIGDEVDAYSAQLRQATNFDRFTGTLRGFSMAKDKAQYLINHGYPQYSRMYKEEGKNRRMAPPAFEGAQSGSLYRTASWFYRVR